MPGSGTDGTGTSTPSCGKAGRAATGANTRTGTPCRPKWPTSRFMVRATPSVW